MVIPLGFWKHNSVFAQVFNPDFRFYSGGPRFLGTNFATATRAFKGAEWESLLNLHRPEAGL